jgi:hypothetical protein
MGAMPGPFAMARFKAETCYRLGVFSRVVKHAIAVFLFIAFLAPCYAGDDYEPHIKNLAAGSPEKDIKASLRTLEAAGIAAFPTLIAHFSSREPAEPRFFQRQVAERAPDGTFRMHRPTIGEVCFDIVQGQIEGNWPKGFRQYYVLTPINTKEWLDAHSGLKLAQLRRSSLTESLRRAEADLAKDQSAEFFKTAVAFLREELESTKQ